MVHKQKASVLLLSVLLVFSLVFAGGGIFLFQKERMKNVALQEELEEIKTRQRLTESKLEESKKTITSLETKLQDAQAQMDKLTSELEGEKQTKLESLAKIEQLRIDLEQQKGLRTDLEKKFNQSQTELKKVQAQLQNLESQRELLAKKVDTLEVQSQQVSSPGVELGTIVVGSESLPAEKPRGSTREFGYAGAPLEGSVLLINRDYNFIVMDIGSKDGVSLNNVFSVYHSDRYLGDVKVEKVHDNMAAAGFLASGLREVVSEGDRVVKKTR